MGGRDEREDIFEVAKMAFAHCIHIVFIGGFPYGLSLTTAF
jgi:hypothetical protein